MSKPIHVKPSFYSYCFEQLKAIAIMNGYNLCIHGSLNRDLDLIAFPWIEKVNDADAMLKEFASCIGGHLIPHGFKEGSTDIVYYSTLPHGRRCYVINMNRSRYMAEGEPKDPEYYIDVSVIVP
jgi:hypothetical protein